LQQNLDPAFSQTLALAILDTIPEPCLVLDGKFCVLAATRSFYAVFEESPATVHGRSLFELGKGEWDIAELRRLLFAIIPDQSVMEKYEVETEVAHSGRRTMQLSARTVHYEGTLGTTILLSFNDITDRRRIEHEKQALQNRTDVLLEQHKILLAEMRHRVANSLQIIASILLLKSRAVSSEETRQELNDAHSRVLSIAEVQKHLYPAGGAELVDIKLYLTNLTTSINKSIVGDQKIQIFVSVEKGSTLVSSSAVSVGLIVTELLINAIKYAFPVARADACVRISFEQDGEDWKLSVADNGVGMRAKPTPPNPGGLGTAIVAALVKQLGAKLTEASTKTGLTISIERATFVSALPKAA
jgi:two-component sensor histidine kinase